MRRCACAAALLPRVLTLRRATPRCAGTAVAFARGYEVVVVDAAGETLASYAAPEACEAWDGRADLDIHSVRWVPDADAPGGPPAPPGTMPAGVVLAGVTLGPASEEDDWESESLETSPVLTLRGGADGALTARVLSAIYGVCGPAAPPASGPYLHAAALPPWGVTLVAHRKAADDQVAVLRTGAGSAPAHLERRLDEDRPHLGATADDGDVFATGLALCRTENAFELLNVADPAAPPLPPGPIALVATSVGRLHVFAFGWYDQSIYQPGLLRAPQPLPPPQQPPATPPAAPPVAVPAAVQQAAPVAAAQAPAKLSPLSAQPAAAPAFPSLFPPAAAPAAPPLFPPAAAPAFPTPAFPPAAAAFPSFAPSSSPFGASPKPLTPAPSAPPSWPTAAPAPPAPQPPPPPAAEAPKAVPVLKFRADLPPSPPPPAPRTYEAATEERGGLFAVCADVHEAAAECAALADDIGALIARVRGEADGVPFTEASVAVRIPPGVAFPHGWWAN